MIVGILDENSKKLDTENSCRSRNNEIEVNTILETNYDCLVVCRFSALLLYCKSVPGKYY